MIAIIVLVLINIFSIYKWLRNIKWVLLWDWVQDFLRVKNPAIISQWTKEYGNCRTLIVINTF